MDIEYTTDYYDDYGSEEYDFHQFDGKTCFDYLEIRDGNSNDSALLGKYCGDSDVLNLPITLMTSGEFLWLRGVLHLLPHNSNYVLKVEDKSK